MAGSADAGGQAQGNTTAIGFHLCVSNRLDYRALPDRLPPRGVAMHLNLFGQGHSRREVREALDQHQKRDRGILQFLDMVVGVCVLYLIRNQPMLDAVAIFIGVFAALSGVRYFVDQSVRNFYLHRLDWEESPPN